MNVNDHDTFVRVPASLQQVTHLSGDDKILLSKIVSLADNQRHYCYATDRMLAKQTGRSKRMIGYSLSKLERLGYIYKENSFEYGDITTTRRKIYIHPLIKRLFDNLKNKKGSPLY
nr:helix-turn-helix domain-containing protein [Fructilactobacillus hinvesii]